MNLVTRQKLNDLYFRSEPLSKDQFRAMCESGQLPALKIGARWRVDLDNMFMDEKTSIVNQVKLELVR